MQEEKIVKVIIPMGTIGTTEILLTRKRFKEEIFNPTSFLKKYPGGRIVISPDVMDIPGLKITSNSDGIMITSSRCQ